MRLTMHFPLFGIAQNDFAALFIEAGDPKLFDRSGARQIKRLFDLIFDRQPVAVPAKAARYVIPFHGFVAQDNIFDGASQMMSIVGQPCRKGRPIIKAKSRAGFSALRQSFQKCAPLAKRRECAARARRKFPDISSNIVYLFKTCGHIITLQLKLSNNV